MLKPYSTNISEAKLNKGTNWSWLLPEQELEDQFSLDHVSTAASPRSQGVFVEGTNQQVQCIS